MTRPKCKHCFMWGIRGGEDEPKHFVIMCGHCFWIKDRIEAYEVNSADYSRIKRATASFNEYHARKGCASRKAEREEYAWPL